MFLDKCDLKRHPNLSSLDDSTAVVLGRAACGAVENYCNRRFALTDYDELYPGTFSRSLFLNQYPVTQVRAVRYGRTSAVQVQNTTPNIQAATVQVTADALVLTLTNNATDTVNTLTWATYPTLGALATAIGNLGNGWTVTINGQFSSWASADLQVYQITESARQTTVALSPHWQYASGYQLNPDSGELVGSWYGSGRWAYRIKYSAGYATIPDALVQATVELAAATYSASKSDPNLVSESLGVYSYTRAATKSLADLSTATYQTLRFFRKPTVPYFGVR